MPDHNSIEETIKNNGDANQLKIVKAGQDLNDAGVQSPEVEGSGQSTKANDVGVSAEYEANYKPPRENKTSELGSGEKEKTPSTVSADVSESKSQNRGMEYLQTIDQFLGRTEGLEPGMTMEQLMAKGMDAKEQELFTSMASAVLVSKGIEATAERIGEMTVDELNVGVKEIGEQIKDGKEVSTEVGDMLKETETLMDVLKHGEKKAAELGVSRPGVTGADIDEAAENKSEAKGMGDNCAGLDNADKSPEEKKVEGKAESDDINDLGAESGHGVNDIKGPDATPHVDMGGPDQGRGM